MLKAIKSHSIYFVTRQLLSFFVLLPISTTMDEDMKMHTTLCTLKLLHILTLESKDYVPNGNFLADDDDFDNYDDNNNNKDDNKNNDDYKDHYEDKNKSNNDDSHKDKDKVACHMQDFCVTKLYILFRCSCFVSKMLLTTKN